MKSDPIHLSLGLPCRDRIMMVSDPEEMEARLQGHADGMKVPRSLCIPFQQVLSRFFNQVSLSDQVSTL